MTIEMILIVFAIAHFSAFLAFGFQSAIFQGRTTSTLAYLRSEVHELKQSVREIKTALRR